ncbi:MAG: protein-disulfide reductase DsbD N-terminal domain-containing protein [Crocinitomicaceae bacterium]
MKFILILFAFLAFSSFAQDKISWTGEFDAKNNKAILTANLAEGWHLYSQNLEESAGPVATRFELAPNDLIQIGSTMREPLPIRAYDANFEANVQYFEKKVNFEQQLTATASTQAIYTVTYMVCNLEMCLPPVDEEVKIMITK